MITKEYFVFYFLCRIGRHTRPYLMLTRVG